MELAEREKQAVAEVGRQLDQIQNCYHFHSKLCDNSFESEKRKIWENERERGIHRLKKWLDFWPILFLEYGIFLFFQIPFFGRWIFYFLTFACASLVLGSMFLEWSGKVEGDLEWLGNLGRFEFLFKILNSSFTNTIKFITDLHRIFYKLASVLLIHPDKTKFLMQN